jgi:hypothetical protein
MPAHHEYYLFEYEVPARYAIGDRSYWLAFDGFAGPITPGSLNHFATREDALIVYREHRLDAHEWPVRLVRISFEVVPID